MHFKLFGKLCTNLTAFQMHFKCLGVQKDILNAFLMYLVLSQILVPCWNAFQMHYNFCQMSMNINITFQMHFKCVRCFAWRNAKALMYFKCISFFDRNVECFREMHLKCIFPTVAPVGQKFSQNSWLKISIDVIHLKWIQVLLVVTCTLIYTPRYVNWSTVLIPTPSPNPPAERQTGNWLLGGCE